MRQFDIKGIKVTTGVYIQDIDCKLWKTEDWDGSSKPNAIAVITPQHKFLIALMQSPSCVPIHSNCIEPWEQSMKSFANLREAEADYDGVGNTKAILALQPLSYYAAGICNKFIFPNLITRGYFPSCGELRLAYDNKKAINAALQACGGTPMGKCIYESSTFYSQDDIPSRGFYEVSFKNGFAWSSTCYHKGQYLRVFAELD